MRWCIQIAEALTYLHTRPTVIIHRDLKLSNILLTKGSKAVQEAKIADFVSQNVVMSASRGREVQCVIVCGSSVGPKYWEVWLKKAEHLGSADHVKYQ